MNNKKYLILLHINQFRFNLATRWYQRWWWRWMAEWRRWRRRWLVKRRWWRRLAKQRGMGLKNVHLNKTTEQKAQTFRCRNHQEQEVTSEHRQIQQSLYRDTARQNDAHRNNNNNNKTDDKQRRKKTKNYRPIILTTTKVTI